MTRRYARYLPTGQTPLPTPRPGGEQPLYVRQSEANMWQDR